MLTSMSNANVRAKSLTSTIKTQPRVTEPEISSVVFVIVLPKGSVKNVNVRVLLRQMTPCVNKLIARTLMQYVVAWDHVYVEIVCVIHEW